ASNAGLFLFCSSCGSRGKLQFCWAQMVFSSPIFLFLFFPLVLLGLAIPNLRLRNLWLLIFSIIFYACGEVIFVFLMLASTLMNYFLGRWVEKEAEPSRRKWAVGVAVALNI